MGKTLSARRYAHWDQAGPFIEKWDRRHPSRAKINAALARSRTVFHTPNVLGTLRDLRETLDDHLRRMESCIDDHLYRDAKGCRIIKYERLVEMLIFDEAERLSVTALEFVILKSTVASALLITTVPCRATNSLSF